MWLLMPRKEVTDGFFRIQMLVALALCVLLVLSMHTENVPQETNSLTNPLATGMRRQAGNQLIRCVQLIAAVVAFAGHIVWKLGRRLPGAVAIYAVAIQS